MENMNNQLNELYKLHIASNEVPHGIKINEDWTLFEPTKFIYAYFTFNSFYSFNWQNSIEMKNLILWENDIYRKNKKSPLESKKISEIVKFIVNENNEIRKMFSDYLNDKLNQNQFEVEKVLGMISPDQNINEKMIKGFIKNISLLREGEAQGNKLKKALYNALYFIYRVRNNIFHGTKTILDILDVNQAKRLKIYTIILQATNEMLFEVVSKKLNWNSNEISSMHDYKLKRLKSENSRKFTQRSFSRKFNLHIPNGILFYPCCGDDTYEPIKLFMDSIQEFHFADSRLKPKLPILECNLESSNSDFQNHIIGKRGQIIIPKDIIIDMIEEEAIEIEVDEEIIKKLDNLQIRLDDYRNSASKIYKQTWFNTDKKNKSIEIFRYVQDGIVTLLSLSNISVFFYRGDSHGEGGSSQWWLGPQIFNLILSKLVDGGIIVTDGSNPDQNLLNVEYNQLWINSHLMRNSIIKEPKSFIYKDRSFVLLGECGHRYGQVYAWQVNKIIKD